MINYTHCQYYSLCTLPLIKKNFTTIPSVNLHTKHSWNQYVPRRSHDIESSTKWTQKNYLNISAWLIHLYLWRFKTKIFFSIPILLIFITHQFMCLWPHFSYIYRPRALTVKKVSILGNEITLSTICGSQRIDEEEISTVSTENSNLANIFFRSSVKS